MQSTIEYLLVNNLLAILHVGKHIKRTNWIDTVEKYVLHGLESIFRFHCNFDRLWCKAEKKEFHFC